MTRNTMLTTASLLSIVFLIFHMTDDILREGGMALRGTSNLTVVVVLGLWLYGALALAGRKSGYIINLVFSLLAGLVPYLHMRGSGLLGPRTMTLGFGPKFFWVWTLFGLGITGALGFLLSLHGLASLRAALRTSAAAL